MELDDLKAEWQALHAQMARQTALNLHLFRQGQMEKARHGLRPLAWGQAIGTAFGAMVMLVSAGFWTSHLQVPHLLITGLLMHAYGLALVLFGARTLFLISHIDYGAPVVEIQRQLAALRRFYVRGGIWLGLPWFALWIPCLEMLFVGLFGADLYAHVHSFLAILVLPNLALWLAALAFLHWTRKRPALARRMDAFWAGSSLARSQRALDEIAKFEQE